MPQTVSTLQRHVVQLHTAERAAIAAARQYNAERLTEGEVATVNATAGWPLDFTPLVGEEIARLPSEVSGLGYDEEPRPPVAHLTDSEGMWLGVALGVTALLSAAALTWVLPMAWATVKGWL